MTQRTWNVDAKGVWEIDRAHFPTPLSPWFREIMPVAFPRGFKEATERVGLLMSHIEPRFVNGFMYMQPVIVGAPRGAKSLPPKFIFKALSALHPAVRRRVKAQSTVFERRPWRDDLELWRKQIRVQATATHLALQATDPAKLDDAALATWLEKLFANATEQYYNHHRFTITVVMPVGDFIAHVEEWTGMSPGEAIQALRQDHGVVTDEGERFTALVGALRDDASLARHLDNGDPAEALRLVAADRGRVGDALRAYFELTEHRLVTGYDVTDLTTGEMPGLVVRSLRAALAGAKPQGAADREQLRATIRDRVPEKHRALYDQLLGDAIEISNLREERALVCDFWAFGIARRALKEAGRRLAAAGLLADAEHVFDASLAEQQALLARTAAPPPSELADRAAWRRSATADDAPQYIGGTPPAPPPVDWYPASAQRSVRATEAVMRCLFAEGVAAKEPKLVRGLNASSGIYEGRARVVLKPEHFPRIEQGDVLIARCTTEAYNGIIPLLGAVVTDRGGVLSHAATVAREFGIPAVVGTQNATQTIPDGARVRVDGTRGEARLV